MMTQVDLLETPIEFLKGVGPKRADVLRKEFNIFTFGDLLLYYPYRHIDKSKIYHIADIQSEGAYIQLKGNEEGREEGREQGMQQGEANTKQLLALNMFTKGLDPVLIAEITGLTEDEVLVLVQK